MRRVKVKLFKRTNPDELVAEITGIGKTVQEAERHAVEALNKMERGLESNRRKNKAKRRKPAKRRRVTKRVIIRKAQKAYRKRRKNPKRRKSLNFGERMKRLRAKKARAKRR